MVLIRDLSVYDPQPIPYGTYDGLIIRCFNGSVKDSAFEAHKAGAKAAGKPWWPYMFFNFLYPALPQIQTVIGIIKDDPGNLPLAIDVEQWGTHTFPPRETLLQQLQTLYANYYAVMGAFPFFYLNPAAIHYLKPIPDWLLKCPLWIAHWGVAVPDYEPWAKWTFRQYQGEPDLNRFNGTDAEYWAYVNKTPLPDKVRVTANVLNIRRTPNGIIAGNVPLGTILGVTGEALDGNGDKWFRVGSCYCASWWCEEV